MAERDVMYLVPSRGRPAAARDLADTFAALVGDRGVCTILTDPDDPTLGQYADAFTDPGPVILSLTLPNTEGMVAALNRGAVMAARSGFRYVGFMGDDHRPRTKDFDEILASYLDRGDAVVYADDLFQREILPTAVLLDARIVLALGFMAPPVLRHMFADDFWLTLGRALGKVRYVPKVVIEHVHPHAGKAEPDEGYERVWPLIESDRQAWARYLADSFPDDHRRVTEALA